MTETIIKIIYFGHVIVVLIRVDTLSKSFQTHVLLSLAVVSNSSVRAKCAIE